MDYSFNITYQKGKDNITTYCRQYEVDEQQEIQPKKATITAGVAVAAEKDRREM